MYAACTFFRKAHECAFDVMEAEGVIVCVAVRLVCVFNMCVGITVGSADKDKSFGVR